MRAASKMGATALRSVHVVQQREVAERRFRDVAAKPAAAVTPAELGKSQRRLPLA